MLRPRQLRGAQIATLLAKSPVHPGPAIINNNGARVTASGHGHPQSLFGRPTTNIDSVRMTGCEVSPRQGVEWLVFVVIKGGFRLLCKSARVRSSRMITKVL